MCYILIKINVYVKSNDDMEEKFVIFFFIMGIKSGILIYYIFMIDSDKGWLWVFLLFDKKEIFIVDIINFFVLNIIVEEKKLLVIFFLFFVGKGS